MPDISVIIVNHNSRNALSKAMVAVRKWSGTLQVQTIVVDNASTDGSGQMVYRLYSNVHLIANGSDVGFVRAGNQGIEAATGRYIMLLDAHAEVTSGCLDTLVQVMDAHPRVGACSPQLVSAGGEVAPGAFPSVWSSRRSAARQTRERPTQEVDWLHSACLMVRREVIQQIGGLDARLRHWFGDVHWCLRMQRARWQRVVVPSAVCHYECPVQDDLPREFGRLRDEYVFWRIARGWLPTWALYNTRQLRLGANWSRLVVANVLAHNRDPEIKSGLRCAAARLGWHLRRGPAILLGSQRPGASAASGEGARHLARKSSVR